jgi:cysteinyl-tRNA synthetase
MPRATESVQGMIALIARLIEKGNAYAVGEPGSRVVYFRVKSFPDYGRLSGNTLDRLKEGEGGRINAEHQGQKEHPADFLLWKEDSRHKMKWDSPWGTGYPGWHIECSVMSAARLCASSDRASRASERSVTSSNVSDLGLTPEALHALTIPNAAPIIDLHSGGEDNIFPHHECEIAQSCCAFNQSPAGAPYAAMWFHPRFLMVEGTKMSKSKGNFFTARDLFAKGIEPAALRLELIKTHYRSNANFTMQGLTDSQRMVDRWRRIAESSKQQSSKPQIQNFDAPVLRDFAQSLHDDLNIAGAIAAVNSWVGSITTPMPEDAAIMRLLDQVLGVLDLERPQAAQSEIGIFLPGTTPDPVVIAKLEDRRAARAAKDFKKSDQIRDELLALGYAIKDVAGGKVEVSRAKS